MELDVGQGDAEVKDEVGERVRISGGGVVHDDEEEKANELRSGSNGELDGVE